MKYICSLSIQLPSYHLKEVSLCLPPVCFGFYRNVQGHLAIFQYINYHGSVQLLTRFNSFKSQSTVRALPLIDLDLLFLYLHVVSVLACSAELGYGVVHRSEICLKMAQDVSFMRKRHLPSFIFFSKKFMFMSLFVLQKHH